MTNAMPDNPEDYPIAVVALNKPLRRYFDYLIPEQLRGRVHIGGRVKVPFGHQKAALGYCVDLRRDTDVPAGKLREITKPVDDEPVFTPRMLRLARWMADYYHCAMGEAMAAAVPSAVHARRRRRKVQCVRLLMGQGEAEEKADEIFDRSPAQSKALRTLARMDGEPPVVELKRAADVSRTTVKALARRDIVKIEKQVVEEDDPLETVEAELEEPYELTREQQAVYDSVTRRIRKGKFDVMLLHGVTSSGKTEIYLQTIAEVVAEGKQAIVLVPEISLTPQTVRHFRSRFRNLAVLHSRLTERQRRYYWHQIREGEADVVIGARSAIFAPVRKLGLLVIDEEHENSFKQDSVPRYHARDVGIMRAKFDNALVLLGTATPSLESYYNAKTGKYTAFHLKKRIGNRPMPPVQVVDMRHEWAGKGNPRVISRRLEDCVRESLRKEEQVILFLNRRGYSPFIKCPRCGYSLECERCEITMNFHRHINVVKCHYCGLEMRPPAQCPECGCENIRFGGAGTERVENAVEKRLPEASILRMDSDTMKTRTAHEDTLEEFRQGRANVLVGTQMIAKGLDFPTVTTVGVVNSDVSLHLPDFRSRERTFQLLAQVAGRTGRGEAGGRVILQTFLPEDPSIQAAAEHDFERFAELELQTRRRLKYPPYGRMVRFICRGKKWEEIDEYMKDLVGRIKILCREVGEGATVLGPATAPVAKIKRRYRYHALLKCPNSGVVHKILDDLEGHLDGPSGAKVVVDVDPQSML
ncbi:MAG: replication restart helicase PriA [Planctomycetota bacterium]